MSGMQIPRDIHSKIQEENDIARTDESARRTVPRIRLPKGKPDSRGACHGGPCPHVGRYSAEVQRLAGRGIHQRQERNLDCAGLFGTGPEFRRAAFLDPWYYVSTVGREKRVIAEYIRNQEKRDVDEDRQLGLGF